MKPKSIIMTTAGVTYYPVNYMGGDIGVTATPTNANYDVAYTHAPIDDGAESVTTWVDVSGMSAATTQQSKQLGPATCLRITLNSGTQLQVDIVQRDA